jgi:ABC-type sugar transport system, periplasmic component
MKKFMTTLFAVFFIAATAVGCGSKSSTASNENGSTKQATTLNGKKLTKMGLSIQALDNEFNTNLQKSLEATAKEYGVELITSDAEQSNAKQVEQIENMVTAGCQAIVVGAVDPKGVLDALKYAKDNGVVISLVGIVPESKDYYDAVGNVEQFDLGNTAAKAAAEWIDKTFPDAADGSVEVGLLLLNNNDEAKKRAEGLKQVEKLTKKAKIVVEYDSTGAQSIPTKAQEYADMMLIQHPNVKCILAYSDFMGLPADEVVMRTPSIDKTKFGIFACDYSEAGVKAINKSINNESTYRASAAFGVTFGKTMFDTIVGNVKLDDKGVYYEPAFPINADNVKEYVK